MDFDTYQKEAQKTAIYPTTGIKGFLYTSIGLMGEAGEIANKVGKVIRDHNDEIPDELRESLKHELGDVLWFASQLARELDIPFDDIAEENIAKLRSRQERGKLKGSGDKR